MDEFFDDSQAPQTRIKDTNGLLGNGYSLA